jgi:hypothetical protein
MKTGTAERGETETLALKGQRLSWELLGKEDRHYNDHKRRW